MRNEEPLRMTLSQRVWFAEPFGDGVESARLRAY